MANLADMALTPDDKFSIAQALYWYCADYHGGQWSKEYAVMCQLGYHPGRTECGVDRWNNQQPGVWQYGSCAE